MNEYANVTIVTHSKSDTTLTVVNNSTLVKNSSYPTNVYVKDLAKTVVTVNQTSVTLSTSLVLKDQNTVTSDLSYNDLVDKPVLGTSSELNYSSNGDALFDEVVLGNDSRLTDKRDPNPHSHSIDEVNNLSNSIESVIKTMGFISSAFGGISSTGIYPYLYSTDLLNFSTIQPSNNEDVLSFDLDNKLIVLKGSCKAVVFFTFSGMSEGNNSVIFNLIDYPSHNVVDSCVVFLGDGKFTINNSLQFTSNSFQTTSNLRLSVSIANTKQLDLTSLDFFVIVNKQEETKNSSTYSLVTTDPILISQGYADIGYAVTGDLLMNSAIVFLDLSENDFDNSGKLLYNRDYLVEDHFGVTVIGSKLQLPLHLDGKYVVVSYVK
jgi:hypothetical protein